MKTLLIDDIDGCLACPLVRPNSKEGYFYCGHIDSPEDHVIKRMDKLFVLDFELIEDYLPEWCPLPDTEE